MTQNLPWSRPSLLIRIVCEAWEIAKVGHGAGLILFWNVTRPAD